MGPNSLIVLARTLSAADLGSISLYLLGGVFLFSAISKGLRLSDTAVAMSNFRLTSQPRRDVALTLVGLESALGLWLASGLIPLAAGFLATAVLVSFTGLLARERMSGRNFACMCFGNPAERIGAASVIRSAALAIIALFATVSLMRSGAPMLGPSASHAAIGFGLLSVASLALQIPRIQRSYREVGPTVRQRPRRMTA
jgi:hypothetical protein